ncbi:MAG: diaminopimelate epimerase [Bacteroidetes bacterium]|nr:diaminopimelate epimerase [Bacteroidota bacterium]
MRFEKYQGTGNDFVLLDGRNVDVEILDIKTVKNLCDRKFGIGADGLMLIATSTLADFKMIYYNSDGKEGSMCGNGARCAVAFSYKAGIISKMHTRFETCDGIHYANIMEDENSDSLVIEISMNDVNNAERAGDQFVINTGSPHYIEFCSGIATMDVTKQGRAIRNQEKFIKDGINVNFVEENDGHIAMRTYERGVENETLSCGTGVTAAALAFAIKHNLSGKHFQEVRTLGGPLQVNFYTDGKLFSEITLTGPAAFIFKGEITI